MNYRDGSGTVTMDAWRNKFETFNDMEKFIFKLHEAVGIKRLIDADMLLIIIEQMREDSIELTGIKRADVITQIGIPSVPF